MADPIGEALVIVRPDFTQFQAQLQAGLAAAVARLPPVAIPITPVVSPTAAGAAATVGAQTAQVAGLAAATGQLAAQQAAAATAALGLASAQTAANSAIAAGGVVLGQTAAAATTAANQTAAAGTAAGAAAKGISQSTTAANAFRGAVIGISHITPVAIFGLGVMGTAAVATALSIRAAVESAAQFEQQMNVFREVTQATAAEMQTISEAARALGADLSLPATSANDAASAFTELAKAGVNVEDSMGAIRGVLQLAAAAGVGAGEAARITASALNAFGLEGEEAARVADLLAASSIAAQGEISDMALALGQSEAVAAQAGISIEETATAISLLAKNGLLGSDAGTSLRTTILRLVPTTKEAAQFTEALGIQFEDAAGNLRPLPEIFESYRQALAELSPVTRQMALTQIFGQDAIRAAAIFAREGAAGFAEMEAAVEREGAAADLASARTEGLAGAMEGLNSSLDTLGTQLGNVVIPFLTSMTNSLATAVQGVTGFFDGIGLAVGVFDRWVSGGDRVVDTTEEITAEMQKLNEEAEHFRQIADGQVPQSILDRLAALERQLNDMQGAGLNAASGIEAFRAELGFLDRETATQIRLDPFPDREDVRARTNEFAQEFEENLTDLRNRLRGDLQFLGELGVEAEAGAGVRQIVLDTVAELKKLGPRGEEAIRDLPPRLRKILNEVRTLGQEGDQEQFEIPLRFRIRINEAELSGSEGALAAELGRTETFLRNLLNNTREGTERFEQIQDALISVHNRRQTILQGIAADRDRADREAADAIKEAVSTRQTQLETALLEAEATENVALIRRRGNALIAFFRAQSENASLTASEREKFEQQAVKESQDLKETIARITSERADEAFSFQELKLQNQLLANELTIGDGDNKATLRKIIDFYHDAAVAADLKTVAGQQLLAKELQYKKTLQDLNKAIGESNEVFAQTLFDMAAEEFRRFGSNISTAGGILAPQDARGFFAGALTGGGDRFGFNQTTNRLAADQLAETKKQTAILEGIAGNTQPLPRARDRVGPEDGDAITRASDGGRRRGGL